MEHWCWTNIRRADIAWLRGNKTCIPSLTAIHAKQWTDKIKEFLERNAPVRKFTVRCCDEDGNVTIRRVSPHVLEDPLQFYYNWTDDNATEIVSTIMYNGKVVVGDDLFAR